MPQATLGVLAMPDDDTLVDLARAGDPSAREELFRRHFAVAYRVAHRLLGHDHDAYDAVQEGYLKAYLHLSDFDGRSGFRTWLLKIVHNAALDVGRKRSRRLRLRFEDGTGDECEAAVYDDPGSALRREDLRRVVNSALQRLRPTLRTTFVLFADAGLSYKEIAEVQDIPVGTVMSRLHEARRKLRTFLDGVDL
jgi:RNA polymerase sigma-70 factor (ECF subfamily)